MDRSDSTLFSASQPLVIAVVGPTASGKTAIADRLAHELGSTVISTDALQVYRGMDIGTAKPHPSELTAPLIGIDLVDPDQPYSVAQFQVYAREQCDNLMRADRIPVLCGGTCLYTKAVIDDLNFADGAQLPEENPIRAYWTQFELDYGYLELHEALVERDLNAARKIHPKNVKRVIRALELAEQGQSYAQASANIHEVDPYYRTVLVCFDIERSVLYERIDTRVDLMIKSGLTQEVAALIERGITRSSTAREAIGYKELLPYLEAHGADPTADPQAFEACVEMIKQNTRRFAKRQLTWLKRDPRVIWIEATNLDDDQKYRALKAALEREGLWHDSEQKR